MTAISHRPEPEAVDERSSGAALRAIATLETVKGIVVILIGLGLLTLLHKDVEQEAEQLIVHLHMNPDKRLSQALLHAASRITDGRLWTYAGVCVAYSTVRFTEAYGLWHRRVWAEWFALLSGTLYLPWEILSIIEHPTALHWGMLIVNLAIVLYMVYIRVAACRPPECVPGSQTQALKVNLSH